MEAFSGLTEMFSFATQNQMTLQTFNRVWCKMMLQRYMGAYLDNNLSVDQLSLELANGNLELECLYMNTKAISQILSQSGVPLKLADGYLGKIKIEIPWLRLMTDPTKMHIEELQLTFRGADVVKQDGVDKETIASMVGSIINSLNSEDMAKSIFDEVSKGNNMISELLGSDDTADIFSGLIDAVYSRFCLTVNKLTIRLENSPKEGSEMACAIEVHIETLSFMDEQMRSCEMDNTNATDLVTTQPHGVGATTNLSKTITLKGISIHTDIFSNISDGQGDEEDILITSMHIRREKAKQQSPVKSAQNSLHPEMFTSAMSDMDAFHSCYDKLTPSTPASPDQLEPLRHAPAEPSLFSDPIKCAEVIGDITCVFKSKSGENDVSLAEINEKKVDIEFFIKGFHVFATPSQIEIVKRLISSITAPKEIVILQQGKPMDREDYENMTKNMEQNQVPDAPLGNNSFGSNWNHGEVFTEFESLKASKQKDKSSDKEFKTLKPESIKEEATLKVQLGTFLMYIPHVDYLSSEYALQHGGYANCLDLLKKEANTFFKTIEGFSFVSKHGLDKIRLTADSFYPKDHLRIVGGSIGLTGTSKKVANVFSAQSRLVATYFDMLEYLTPESVPGQKEPTRIGLLDYTEQENVERDPNFKLILTTSSENKGVTKVDVYLGACTTELDLSIIDRISNLIVTKPFFDEVSQKHSKQNRVPQLKDDIYGDTAFEDDVKTKTLINLKCPNWRVDLRIPKADLRDPSGSRLPFAQRHVHNEFIRLGITDIDIAIPIENEVSLIEILCGEMCGDFCGDNLNIPSEQKRFLFANRTGFEKINLKLVLNPKTRKLLGPARKSSPSGIPDIMLKSMSADIMMAHPKKEGPFSKIPRSYCSHGGDDKEEIIQAGTRKEILKFQEECENFAATLMYFTVPSLKLHIPEKSYLEVLYNRLVNDLALFQPAAPAFRVVPEVPGKLQPLDSFQECVSPKHYAESEHSDLEDEIPTLRNSVESLDFDREVPHTFVLTLNANKCVVLCNTSVKEDEKEAQPSQVSLDLEKVHIGTTAGYHGDINHTFFHFTSSKAAVGCLDVTKEARMPNSINMKDFGKWSKDLTQLEYVATTDELSTGSTEDAFAVALHMNFKPDENVKDVLLGIALRNSQFQARPFKSWSNFWMTQLAEHFTLQDYAIPGYELPQISTDLHICFENAIVGYDHAWLNPESKLKLRAALGQCNLSSSIVSDMSISKTLCIFENCRLYMCRDSLNNAVRFEGISAPKVSSKKFIPFLDIGSVQLDILFAVGENHDQRTSPAFEIRCQNDIIKAWACADSLAAFIKMILEYTSEEKSTVKTSDSNQSDEMEQSTRNEDINKSVAGESIWSDASTGSKQVQKMSTGAPLSDDVEKRMQAIIQEAVREESLGIAIGEDAVQEFSMTPSKRNLNESNDSFEHVAHRNFKQTDDEFCMVDDTVFGSGITITPGDSRIRDIPGGWSIEDQFPVKGEFHTLIDDFGNDELYQQMAGRMNPALRYLLKDVTIQLSLYAGNDLSTFASPSKTYCTEEYRNGRGPEQRIEENSHGGPNRDHSAFVTLELTKITYLKQIFEKNVPLLSTTLFQIGDVIIKDRVRASTIQEMLYQFSCASNPRRTGTPILSVRMSETHSREGKMRVSMLPIKINVDQDTLEFLTDYFEETFKLLDLPKHQMSVPQLIQKPVIEVPAEITPMKHTPKNSVSSTEDEVPRIYPTVPNSPLTLEPLKPSPVKPATPLGDLSYLEKISQNHQSPVKRPIIDAPLTASAISIGAMFESPRNSRQSNELEEQGDIDPTEMRSIAEEIEMLDKIEKRPMLSSHSSLDSESNENVSDVEELPFAPKRSQAAKFSPLNSGDLGDLTGDWTDDDNIAYTTCIYQNEPLYQEAAGLDCGISPIKKKHYEKPTTKQTLYDFDDYECPDAPVTSSPVRSSRNLKMKAERLSPLKMPQPLSNDDILMRSTMMGSVHPSQSVHNLVDTSDDQDEEEHGNFLDSIDDDENESEKQKVEQEMEDQKVEDAATLSHEIQEGVERGETFYKQFVFSPSVNIYVDYQGKRKISVEKAGALVGLLMAFGQLNQMPIQLREINCRTGLLGTGRCLQHAVSEWSGDLLTNMPSVIASYGPISPLVQIGRGVVDLFWMPVAEFRKPDGNVVKGMQRGVGSFSVSSAAGLVGMAQTVTGFVQSIAEMTMREMKPDDPSTRRAAVRRYNRNHGMNPTDVRHSLQLAYGILYDGYHQTRDDLELAAQEDRASGNSVIRSAFRYAVPTFLGPVVMATQVTYQLLGGLRNQLRPDAYQDERRKWGEKDVPGGVHHK